MISAEARAAFERDGVVKIPGAVDGGWVERILEDAQAQLDDPGPWVTDTNRGAATDRLFTTRYRWQHAPVIRDFVFASPVAQMAASLTGSERMRFYFDHLLVKEPLTSAPTPWHQDIPYWPFLGKQIVSVWVSATSSRVSQSSLEFVRGSHSWDAYFAPESFDGQGGWTDDFRGEPMPDIEAARHSPDCRYEIGRVRRGAGRRHLLLGLDHPRRAGQRGPGAKGGAVHPLAGRRRHLVPASGLRPTVTQDDTTAVPGRYPADDERFPLVYERSAS